MAHQNGGDLGNLQARMAELEMLLGVSSTRTHREELKWKKIQSNQVVPDTDLPEDYVDEMFLLPKDVYSIIASCKLETKSFWIALLVVCGFQISLLLLLLLDQIENEDGNFLGTPANVEGTVRAAQVLALIIALFNQDDLREGIEGITEGVPTIYRGHESFQVIGPGRWYFSYIIRFLQGFVSLFASFVLLVKAESVFDVLLNFLGVQFISELDDLAFDLGSKGYFGSAVERKILDITQARFLRDSKPHKSDCFAYANVIGIFAVLAVMVGIFSHLWSEQNKGAYSIEHVSVEFGDEIIAFLGLFNGCYRARKEGTTLHGRLVYEQMGSEEGGGKFGFCDDLDGSEGWIFFDGNSNGDPCENYLLRTGTTNTFDILDASSNEWYTQGGQIVDFIQVSELPNSSLSRECGREAFRQTIDSCDQLDIPVRFDNLGGSSSQLFEKLAVTEAQAVASPDATRSHPIYLGVSGSEIILFTGRRWILTTLEQLGQERSGLRDDSGWNHAAVVDYFYNKGFRAIEQIQESDQWVLAMSEVVNAKTDPRTPLALQWFNVRYESSTESNTDRSFPFADLTRPQEAVLECARCGDGLVDCANEGVCIDGVCACKNRATGVLCQDAPLGDGICDEFFNTAEFNYDGGDCCASTCTGVLCGGNGLTVAFGVDLSDNTFQSQYLENSTMAGFENCKDPSMETFTIELLPIQWNDDDYVNKHGEDCGLESVTVTCDGVLYLQTPNLYMAESVDEVEKCHEDVPLIQPIHLPPGVNCELSRPLDDFEWFFEISLLRGNTSFLEGGTDASSLAWSVPSECLQQVFVEYLGDWNKLYDVMSPEGKAIQSMSADGTSTLLCSLDPDQALERYALTVFNVSVGLESTNWKVHQCDGWGSARGGIGITCNDDKRVVSIDGGGQGCVSGMDMLGGTIPSEISLLSHLSYLDLSGNVNETYRGGIVGTLPSEIGLIESLTHLFLNKSSIEGPLPEEFFQLSSLRYLDLGDAFGGAVPTEVGLLSGLSYLNLGRRDNLWGLQGGFNGTLPAEIGNLSNLSYLNLQDNFLSGTLPTAIWRLTGLVELNLARNDFSGSIPSEIGLLSNLSYLDLSGLYHGSIPSEIGRLSALQNLRLGYLDGAALPSEIGLLSQLILKASVNIASIFETLPTEIGYFSGIEDLSIANEDLSGTLPTELCLLTKLTSIWAARNKIIGTIPTEICQLSRLSYLNFESNRLTGSLPSELGCLTQLTYIDMSDNRFSGTLATEIGALTLLESLRLENNRFSGTVPAEIENLSSLTQCRLGGLNASFVETSNKCTFEIPWWSY